MRNLGLGKQRLEDLCVTTYEILHTGRKYFTILLIAITHSQLTDRPYRNFIAKLLIRLYTPFYSTEDTQQRSITCKFISTF